MKSRKAPHSTISDEQKSWRMMSGFEGRWFVVGSALSLGFREGRARACQEIQLAVTAKEAVAQSRLLLENAQSEDLEIETFSSWEEKFLLEARLGDLRISVGSLNTLGLRDRFSHLYELSMQATQMELGTVTLNGVTFPAPFSRTTYLRLLKSQGFIRRLIIEVRTQTVACGWAFRNFSVLVSTFIDTLEWLRRRLGVRLVEFPRVPPDRLRRFDSWDRQLGWDNQPNSIKLDKTDRSLATGHFRKSTPVIISIDGRGSRAAKYGETPAEISIYGDSYAMCRDVADQDTISWYLSSIRGSNCTNYGVGNYGLDQALLKLERNYSSNPTPVVILSATSITMARCVSIYRHYLEPGNVLAVKPRFVIQDNQELRLLEMPFSNREEMRFIKLKRSVLRQFDEHYSTWKSRRAHLALGGFSEIARKFGRPQANQESDKNFEYEASFWRSDGPLFLRMIARFATFSETRGFKPVFLLQHQKRSLVFSRRVPQHDLPWTDSITQAKEMNPKVQFLDERDCFQDLDSTDELYVKSHHSPLANRLVAEYINSAL